MSNLETDPAEVVCDGEQPGADGPAPRELLVPRDVPLGGPRAMNVRRTLPQRRRSLIGAWCFLDHYGPQDLTGQAGMNVPRHPHTGLQTVSWLFTGEIEHRDSTGAHAVVRPGELNLMTAGSGISHSEFSTPDTTILHGAQLWVALPEAARGTSPGFEHHRPDPVCGDDWTARVFLGSLLGSTSPVATHSPLLGAEILLDDGASLALELDPGFEHGVLLDSGALRLDGEDVPVDHLAYLAPDSGRITLEGHDGGARLLLIGGEPLGEQIVMWWNFVGRSHEEIVEYRRAWQEEIGAPVGSDPLAAATRVQPPGRHVPHFGPFPPGEPDALPAPALPNARMRPRS
ncbi:pirin family protein [Arthrobacter sp. JSM 101049]|uniref:pirin family protein n=1 Tax=Arthrobacter sp. JSM 101049 TaxID=929097 RepID=UPI003567602C